MELNKEVQRILNLDPVRNTNISCFIKSNKVIGYEVIGESVMIRGISDREWVLFSSKDESEFRNLLLNLKDSSINFAVINDWMIPWISEIYDLKIELSAMKFAITEDIRIPSPKNGVVPLMVSDAEYIYDNSTYKEFLSVEYIKDRIQRGCSAGIYILDKLIAWTITHDDGAIGFLHVLEEYRNRGYAYDLMLAMIAKIRNKGCIPFVHIEENNIPSLNLAGKLGFREYDRVHWAAGIRKNSVVSLR